MQAFIFLTESIFVINLYSFVLKEIWIEFEFSSREVAEFLIVTFCLLVFFSYIEKFTDFLRLFVSVHLRRIESYSQFPVVEFLTLLFKYTFHQVKHWNCPCLSLATQNVYFVTFRRKNFFILFVKHLYSAYYMKINTFILHNNPMR